MEQTNHCVDVFMKTLCMAMTLGQLPRRLAIRKYTADAILFRENQSNKKDILMIAAFQVGMQRSHIFGPLYKFLPGPLGDV